MTNSAEQNVFFIVAIDGPAGAGKSTVAKRVAERLGFTFLDTGAIYRTLAYAASRRTISWDDEDRLAELARTLPLRFEQSDGAYRVFLLDEEVTREIRTAEISVGSSKVSRHAKVRTALLAFQRDYARRSSIVAEGRDTGTVVFPHAQLKIFLDASPEIRARRRYEELVRAGKQTSFEEVLRAETARDQADAGRDVAPLKPAEDAHRIDTSTLTIDQVIEQILALKVESSPFKPQQR